MVVIVQLAALVFGGAPGTLSWLFFSRIPSELPDVRTWTSAMHWHVILTVMSYLTLGKQLSPQFLGCSSALLFLSYWSAKQGCYRLGCCGWAPNTTSFQYLRRRIELQKLESMLAFATGAAYLGLALAGLLSQELLYLYAIAMHLLFREIFAGARSCNKYQIS